MKTNHVLILLVAATLAMQAALLYKQYRPVPVPPRRESVATAPNGAVVDLAGLPLRGMDDAELVLVEFSDYECPFCARHAAGVAAQLDKEFVQTGKIRYAFANNPLATHSNATLLATAAICAGEQGQYWEMHNALFETKPKSRDHVEALLPKLSLDAVRFEECLDSSPDAAIRIVAESERAKSLGLSGTPGFALGRADASGRVHVEKIIMGAVPFEIFQKAISEAL